MVGIATKLFTTTSSSHRRINVLQFTVHTRRSPLLMCRLVLWWTVWQFCVFATKSNRQCHRDLLLNDVQILLEVMSLAVRTRVMQETSAHFSYPLRDIGMRMLYVQQNHLLAPLFTETQPFTFSANIKDKPAVTALGILISVAVRNSCAFICCYLR